MNMIHKYIGNLQYTIRVHGAIQLANENQNRRFIKYSHVVTIVSANVTQRSPHVAPRTVAFPVHVQDNAEWTH